MPRSADRLLHGRGRNQRDDDPVLDDGVPAYTGIFRPTRFTKEPKSYLCRKVYAKDGRWWPSAAALSRYLGCRPATVSQQALKNGTVKGVCVSYKPWAGVKYEVL